MPRRWRRSSLSVPVPSGNQNAAVSLRVTALTPGQRGCKHVSQVKAISRSIHEFLVPEDSDFGSRCVRRPPRWILQSLLPSNIGLRLEPKSSLHLALSRRRIASHRQARGRPAGRLAWALLWAWTRCLFQPPGASMAFSSTSGLSPAHVAGRSSGRNASL